MEENRKEIAPGLYTDGSGVHAFVEPGTKTLSLPLRKGLKRSGIRTLDLPASLRSFSGLDQFPDLRIIRYEGREDVFSFAEPLGWLGKNSEDLNSFTQRLAANLAAFRPVSRALCAVVAPHMPPIQAGEGFKTLMAGLEEWLKILQELGGNRQDGSWDYVILCRSYTLFRHLQWCFGLGRSISAAPYDPAVEAGYGPEPRFSPEEQLALILATAQGHSYEDFTGIWGDRRVSLMRDGQDYAEIRRRELRWRDDETFQTQLQALLEDGLITAANYAALLEQLTAHRLTASTSLAIRWGSRNPALREAPPEDDFFL